MTCSPSPSSIALRVYFSRNGPSATITKCALAVRDVPGRRQQVKDALVLDDPAYLPANPSLARD